MAKRWRIHSHSSDRIAALERTAGVSAVVARLLICRGLEDPLTVRNFLDPKLSQLRDPGELPGVPAAAERIWRAVAARERITIYGDYDVDGITGTSLLVQCLRLLGAEVGYYVPHRIDEGYGLNDDALETLSRQRTKLVVTVDCGIASIPQAETSRRLGLDLVITDHHEFGAALPDAAAIVHPRLPGTTYPFAGLSGAGVAFKLAWALCQQASGAKKVGEAMRNYLLSAVGLAALGTVADMVPLVDENRVLVQHGLTSLKQRPGLGMATLMKLAELDRKPSLDSEDVAFSLAPRLNAAGRLGQALLAVELLTTGSAERAQALAEYLNELNGSRQSLERSIYLAAHKLAHEQHDVEGDAAFVLAQRGWHPGVIGIVAGRLVDKYQRPVVLVALDDLGVKPGIGSARSITGFNLHEALTKCSQHLVSHGGHAAAAGLKIEESRVDDFRGDFCEHVAETMAPEQAWRDGAELSIDAEVSFGELTLATLNQMERLAPFGQHNPRPLLCASDVTLAAPAQRIGGGRHLALRLRQHGVVLRAVAFGVGDQAEELDKLAGPLSVAFRPVVNDFNGCRRVELQLSDWQPAGEGRPEKK